MSQLVNLFAFQPCCGGNSTFIKPFQTVFQAKRLSILKLLKISFVAVANCLLLGGNSFFPHFLTFWQNVISEFGSDFGFYRCCDFSYGLIILQESQVSNLVLTRSQKKSSFLFLFRFGLPQLDGCFRTVL